VDIGIRKTVSNEFNNIAYALPASKKHIKLRSSYLLRDTPFKTLVRFEAVSGSLHARLEINQ